MSYLKRLTFTSVLAVVCVGLCAPAALASGPILSYSVTPNLAQMNEVIKFTGTVIGGSLGVPTGTVGFNFYEENGSNYGVSLPLVPTTGNQSAADWYFLPGYHFRPGVGNHSVSGYYSGNLGSAFAGNTSFSIEDTHYFTTYTDLVVSPPAATVGDTITFTSTVTCNDPGPTFVGPSSCDLMSGVVNFYAGEFWYNDGIDDIFRPTALLGSVPVSGNGSLFANFSVEALSVTNGTPILANFVSNTSDYKSSYSWGSSTVYPSPEPSPSSTPEPVVLSISAASGNETDSGLRELHFTVSRSGGTGMVTFDFATGAAASGTAATVGVDYEAVTGSAFIPAGVNSVTVWAHMIGDTMDEDDETFAMTISNVSTGTISNATAIGTIVDNEASPIFTISGGGSVVEGGPLPPITVSMNQPSARTVKVTVASASGTATSGSDFTALGPTELTFLPGNALSQQVSVPILQDTLYEDAEAFTVNLSGASNGTIGTGSVGVTIMDDDVLPKVSIDDVAVTEGNGGTTTATFTVTLSKAIAKAVSFQYQTVDDTATSASSDYVAAGPTPVTFNPADALTKTISITVNGDTGNEPDEQFKVLLSTITNAEFSDTTGFGTITNDDTTPPSLSVNDVTVTEGDSGTTSANFTVTLNPASGQTVTVRVGLGSVTATSGADFQNPGRTTLTFAPGETTKTVTVYVIGDLVAEDNETYAVNLFSASNAVIGDSQGLGTITENADPMPVVSIASASVLEGNSGTKVMTFNLSLNMASGRNVIVTATTSNGTATGGSLATTPGVDYVNRVSTVTFSPGQTSRTFTVTIVGDAVVEANEAFFVTLGSPVNCTISPTAGVGTGTILNDEP